MLILPPLKLSKIFRKNWRFLTFILIGSPLFLLSFAKNLEAASTQHQQCEAGSTCEIGEFLYDDEYQPVATGTCTLVSRYPDGTLFLNSVAMTAGTDAWYSYDIDTTGISLGIYRSQMCCTIDSEYLCLDKTFEVFTDTATSVWSYSDRSLTSLGSLVSDIWSYSDRSLTTFSSLVSNVWGSSTTRTLTTNTLTSSENLASETDVNNLSADIEALLAQVSDVQNDQTWIGEGSIIFEVSVTNPSSTITQTIPLEYYFPKEVRSEYIIKKPVEVEVKYDSVSDSYYLTGEFLLGPKETVVLEVEVKDIWTIPQARIDSLRKQADSLCEPLKNTSYFAQGTALKSDINSSLDKIEGAQKLATTPDEKIKTYHESKIELDSVNRKMEDLKTIVASAGSMGTLSGFIGGVQAIAVWGLIIVLVAGFVFLALYMKKISSSTATPAASSTSPAPAPFTWKISTVEEEANKTVPLPPPSPRKKKRKKTKQSLSFFSFLVLLPLLSLPSIYKIASQPNKKATVLKSSPLLIAILLFSLLLPPHFPAPLHLSRILPPLRHQPQNQLRPPPPCFLTRKKMLNISLLLHSQTLPSISAQSPAATPLF